MSCHDWPTSALPLTLLCTPLYFSTALPVAFKMLSPPSPLRTHAHMLAPPCGAGQHAAIFPSACEQGCSQRAAKLPGHPAQPTNAPVELFLWSTIDHISQHSVTYPAGKLKA